MSPNPHAIVVTRVGRMRVWRRADVPVEDVLAVIGSTGETLKRNAKSVTMRVGGYVVKLSQGPIPIQLVKHTFQRERYRRGWRAALHLEEHGIPAPRAIAHVEWGVAGLVWRHATVTTFLAECRDVEHEYDARVKNGAARDALSRYLDRLAEAVNALLATGALHTDLAGKNILTKNGEAFFFIDLDGIELGTPLDDTRLLQLYVQLYDSFIDRCDDGLLMPFLQRLLPKPEADFDVWLSRVKAAQAVRRARTLAAWAAEGKMGPRTAPDSAPR